MGNLEANIITGRALATTNNVRGGARVRVRGAAAPHPPLATPMQYIEIDFHILQA